MDIHKPKAAHSWREFLVKIGTITCGILIALGLEQALEAWHWREVVNEERAALRDEMGHLRAAIKGRLELEPCFVARLDEVKEIIRRHDAGEPLAIIKPIGRALYPPTTHPILDLAVADQSLAHMKLSEKRKFVGAYEWVSVYDGISSNERAAFRNLQALNHADKLLAGDWSSLRNDYEQARESHEIIAGSAATWLAPFAALASDAPKVSVRDTPPVRAFCTPMLANGSRSQSMSTPGY